jgi:transcriptional regulator with XRE-family HTH domain
VKSIHDPRYLEIISRLRASRKGMKVSQSKLGRRLGKPQSYISKIESCERRIDLVEALKLCEALEISLETIVPVDMKSILSRENK